MTTTKTKPRAIIYGRNSTKMQEEAETIETQLDFITHDPVVALKFDLIGDRDKWYLDSAQSASKKPLWKRRVGKHLLEDAKSPDRDFDVILCYKYNRLGRNLIDTETAINELLNAGVVIYDVKTQMTIDNSSASGILIRQIMGVMAEFEVRNDAEAMRDGLERKARNGELRPTTLRTGFDWSEVYENGHEKEGLKKPGADLVINDEEAKLVKLIFDRYEKSAPSTLSWWLNSNGYRLPRKVQAHRRATGETERMFHYKDIASIINDPIYTGTIEWGRTTTMSGKTSMVHSHHFPELQIISFEQFNRAQAIRQQRKALPPKSAASNYIYSGLVRCPKCGGRTTGTLLSIPKHQSKVKRYVCRNYHAHGKAACDGWTALEPTVTKAVIPFLADLLENRLGLRRYVEEEARNMVMELQETRVQRLRGQLEAAQMQLKRVQELTVQGLMTAEEAKPFIYDARETIERSKSQLASVEQSIILEKELVEAISRVCFDITGTLEGLGPEALQAIIRQVFVNFTIARKSLGRGQVESWIVSYDLKPELKDLLAQSSTLDIGAGLPEGTQQRWPALSQVWPCHQSVDGQ